MCGQLKRCSGRADSADSVSIYIYAHVICHSIARSFRKRTTAHSLALSSAEGATNCFSYISIQTYSGDGGLWPSGRHHEHCQVYIIFVFGPGSAVGIVCILGMRGFEEDMSKLVELSVVVRGVFAKWKSSLFCTIELSCDRSN